MGQPLVDRSVERFDADGTQTVFAVTPFGASETRAERLASWERSGLIDPDCAQCREHYEHPTLNAFAPLHKPGAYCRSGKRPHCTCDGCF